MTTATTGTGTMTLGVAKAGYLTFAEAGIANADTVSYVIIDGNDFEMGIGTYTSAGTTLSRDTVLVSKISGTAGTTKLTLSGTAEVFASPDNTDLAFVDTANTFTATQAFTNISASQITALTTALSVGNGGTGATTLTGVLKGNGTSAFTAATLGTDVMHPGTTSLITKGFTVTPFNNGSKTTGTFTPDPTNGNYQYYTNGGAHTLAAPASDCAIDMLVINGASGAGAITLSGFKTAGTGASGAVYATTANTWWVISIRRINGVSTYSWSGPWT